MLDQQIGGLVGELAQVVEGVAFLLAFLVGPDHCELVAVPDGPGVDDVIAEIEVFGSLYGEVMRQIDRSLGFFYGLFHFITVVVELNRPEPYDYRTALF